MALTTSNAYRMFMAPSVTTLRWKIEAYFTPAGLWPHVRAIVDRMPNITVLQIDCVDIRSLERPLSFLFAMLDKLREVIVPLYSFTREIACALSSLPYLENIVFNNDFGNRFTGQWPTLDGLDSRLPSTFHFLPNAFQSITTFSVSLSCLLRINTLLTTKLHILTKLTCLVVRAPFYDDVDGDSGLFDFCTMISEVGIQLTSLTIWATASGRRPPLSAYHAVHPSLRSLRPLSAIPTLTHLIFAHTLALDFTDLDMDQFARSFPNIEVLMLNHHPVVGSRPHATLNSLSSFASHCHNLKELGLMLDATTVDHSTPYSTFGTRLMTLKLGRSMFPRDNQILERSSVSYRLSAVLPTHVVITAADPDSILDCNDHIFHHPGNRSIVPVDDYDQQISSSNWSALHHLGEVRRERSLEIKEEKRRLREKITELDYFLHA